MAKIIECVPNFSEGKDQNVIDAIAQAVTATDGELEVSTNVAVFLGPLGLILLIPCWLTTYFVII